MGEVARRAETVEDVFARDGVPARLATTVGHSEVTTSEVPQRPRLGVTTSEAPQRPQGAR